MTKEAVIPDKYVFQVAALLKELSDAYGAQAGAYGQRNCLRETQQKQLADMQAAHNVQSAQMQQDVLGVNERVSRLHMQITMLASNIFGAEETSDDETDD